MTSGEDTRRWFVRIPSGENEDVGADYLEIDRGTLVFSNRRNVITFAYAPGQWEFVEYQD